MINSLFQFQRYYFIGIKGAGMTALAEVLASHGKEVSGSDVQEEFFTSAVLHKHGIPVFSGFKKENIPAGTDVVVYSTAYNQNNEEVKAALSNKLPLISYPEALGMLIGEYTESIAVAGTHGKTTITALIGWIFERGGADPTVIIGARSNNWKSNARIGKSPLFIFEADEYQNKFSLYKPKHLIINNIDYDHPDFFKTFSDYRDAFSSFVATIPKDGTVFANYDHLEVRHLVQQSDKHVVWFGEDTLADWGLIARRVQDDGSQIIKVVHNGTHYGEFSVKLIGKHNALNCLPAIALAHKFSIARDDIGDALSSFQGTSRRMEIIGWPNDVLIIDDYAHHPVEIRSTLAALTEQYPNRRLVAVFQPHTYSRTEAFINDFASVWSGVDMLILLDIFSSAREQRGTVSSDDVARAISEYHRNVLTLRGPEEAVLYLKDKLHPGDLLVTVGAGETWKVAEQLAKILSG